MAHKSLLVWSFIVFAILISFSASAVDAATLINVEDRIGTSRPSPSTPVNGTFAIGSGSFTVYDNKSRFLASDSARVINGTTGALVDTLTVVAQSSDLTNVSFTTNSLAVANAGNVLLSPQTSMHTIKFTTVTSIPSSGKIVITFPGSGLNTASASASTFSFNNLQTTGQIAANNASCTWAVSAPTATCTLGSAISPGTAVTIIIGCSAQSGGACTTSLPKLINPTKSVTAGTADLWSVNLATQNASSVELDTGRARIGTIDAVEVKAEVDPTLTFTIAGIADATALGPLATGCSDTTNSGIASTATLVNLGILANGAINESAQKLTVSTNASGGYVISATSSGKFINPTTGYFLASLNKNAGNESALTANDTPVPAVFGASGNDGFGISPCGPRVNTTLWGSGATAFSSGGKYSNPYNSGTNSYYSTIATFTGTTGVSLDDTIVRYAASISGLTPAGIYRNYFTYVATATF